jgi:hypothetical protein
MAAPQRDIFIVHSKSDEREDALVGALVPRLREAGIDVWDYTDWSWEHQVRRQGRGAPRSFGRPEELDPVRFEESHPEPFRAPVREVDEAVLGRMIRGSRVVLLCEPRDGSPSEGVAIERRLLTGQAVGPILIHQHWRGSSDSYFRPLRPATKVSLHPERAPRDLVDELWATVVSAWIVQRMQQDYGRAGGHRLLERIARDEPQLRELVVRSPHYKPPMESTTTAQAAADPALAALADSMERLVEGMLTTKFINWWTKNLLQLQSAADRLGADDRSRALHKLIGGIDCGWREYFTAPADHV